MSEILAKQYSLFHSITRSLDNLKKIGKNNYTPAKIRSRMSAVKETWQQCVNLHASLLQGVPEPKRESIDYFSKQQFDAHEDIYQATLDYMAECLEEMEPPVSLNQPSPRHCESTSSFSLSHLPPINIPPFSGKCEEWESFRDRFTSLIIQNRDLSAFARMHFLASSLTGRALDSIRSIAVTADNFDIAWKTLVSRYDNKRRLVEVHVATLCNLPSVSRESPSELTELRDKANRAITSLKNLNRSLEDILNDILVYSVSQKLDLATRKAWKLKGGDDTTIPTYEDLDRFIASRARALEELTPINNAKLARSQKITSATTSVSSPISCPLCKSAHFINKCPQFVKKGPHQRIEIINKNNRCINCLSAKHAVQSCPSKYTCRTCQKRHHSMLHTDSAPSATESPSEPIASLTKTTENGATTALNATILNSSFRSHVLLATARIKVSSPSGRALVVRALIDQGSEITFITENLRQNLRLRRVKVPISISAVGCVDAGTCRYATHIQISPRDQSHPMLTTTASILKSLTNYSPSPTVPNVNWNHIADLDLADSAPFSDDPIDVLIGADLYGELILDGIRKSTNSQPIAQRTIFGWILSGPTSIPEASRRSITVQHCATSPSLDLMLQRFWEIEDIPQKTLLSPEEQQCEEHFRATHLRSSDGRYVVRLPFKKGPPIEIGESYKSAERCLHGLHRRFKTQPDLNTAEYTQFLDEYERMGHMQRVPVLSKSEQCVYIPHHPVIRASSTTTRLRVVFNASSLTTNATSLNDHLLTGPKLQIDLAAVILRWRQFRYVYAADIAKMYRQIIVDTRDIDYQRILWADPSDNSVQAYQLLTVTYGTASAPYLALRVLQQLIHDEGQAFPLAAPILKENIYVDDVLFGADDIPMLRHLRDQVCALLQKGQFELRKWSSNSSKLLSDLSVENHGLACHKTLQPDEQVKILGITWNPALDVFQFQVSLPSSGPTSKRMILSTVAKLFDPLGWCTPVTISAKIFLQHLWQLKIDWDDIIPSDRQEQWQSIQSSLASLNGLQLNRWIQRGSDTVTCELHGFSDASVTAYAAAVYLRLVSISGEVTSMLLAGKSKVAPIKTISIPRLELAAAVLLSRLLDFVRQSLNLTVVSYYCWTDSMVVLAWVTQHPSKWKTFVSNRVSEIQSRLPLASWNYVPTDDNPADCASRGIVGPQLWTHSLWWQGPAWLRFPASEWPSQINTPSHETSLEQNSRINAHLVKPLEPWDLASRYSSWPKLIRVTAYVMRYIALIRNRASSRSGKENPAALSADDCRLAREFWLRRIQDDVFPLERETLLQRKPLSSKSCILSLNPFLDEAKLICVGGRLSNALISNNTKHPIILASHPLVTLIVQHAHLRSLHAGAQLTLATLRQDFWITRARNAVKAVINRCVVCAREKAVTPIELMGNLPSVRVSPPARAFLHCGLDYAGPISIRAMSGRGIASRKAYIAVFICMATKAIHLEVVDGYSTAAFLGAYSRFCARRGLPEAILTMELLLSERIEN